MLIEQDVLSKYAAGVWFLHGLPSGIAAKVMRKYEIDTEDPGTVEYDRIREFVVKATGSEKAIQRLNGEKGADSSRKREIKELADQVHAGIGIPKEREAFEASFGPMAMPLQTTKGDKAMEELAKSFNQLNLNIGALAQRAVGAGYQDGRAQGGYSYVGSRDAVGVNGMDTVDVGAYGGSLLGSCWYCYNRDPSIRPHRFRDACPLFLHHVLMGTVHVNREGRIALGRDGEGGAEISFWRNQGSQGDQVMKKVAGTKYDPVLANRPAEKSRQEKGRSDASVGFITVDRFEDDSDKEEYEFPEGYGEVSVDTVQVEKDRRKEQER